VPLPYPVSHLHISKQVHPDMPLKASNRSGVYSANTLLRDHSRRLLQGQVHGVETPVVGPDGALYVVDASQTVRCWRCCLLLPAAACCCLLLPAAACCCLLLHGVCRALLGVMLTSHHHRTPNRPSHQHTLQACSSTAHGHLAPGLPLPPPTGAQGGALWWRLGAAV
jgi:hypothetical protein